MSKVKKEKVGLVKISNKILKYWYVDFKTKRIKKLNSYSGKNKLIGFNSETSNVISKTGKSLKLYTSFKEAEIMLQNFKIEKLRVKWKACVDKSMEINKEINKLIDALDKVRDESDWL